MSSIAHGVAQIDASRPEIQILIAEIIEAVLNYFEEQVKTQQYHHKKNNCPFETGVLFFHFLKKCYNGKLSQSFQFRHYFL